MYPNFILLFFNIYRYFLNLIDVFIVYCIWNFVCINISISSFKILLFLFKQFLCIVNICIYVVCCLRGFIHFVWTVTFLLTKYRVKVIIYVFDPFLSCFYISWTYYGICWSGLSVDVVVRSWKDRGPWSDYLLLKRCLVPQPPPNPY